MASTCIAPLSSPYSLLPRVHTYALVFALFVPLPEGWLFRAALAAFTTRTAIFAVDSFRLLATLRNDPTGPARVDILVAAESLALATLIAVWLLTISRRGARSAAHGLLRGWAVVVGIGAIVSFVALKELAHVKTEKECHEALIIKENVFGEEKRFGADLGIMGDKIGFFILRVGIVGITFAVLAFVASVLPRPNAQAHEELPVAIQHHSLRRWRSKGDAILVKHDEDTATKIEQFTRGVRLLLTVTIPAMAIFVVANAEWYFQRLAPDIPSVEKMSSVGQWGVWAATGVVLVATAVSAMMNKASGDTGSSFDHATARDDAVIKF